MKVVVGTLVLVAPAFNGRNGVVHRESIFKLCQERDFDPIWLQDARYYCR